MKYYCCRFCDRIIPESQLCFHLTDHNLSGYPRKDALRFYVEVKSYEYKSEV